LRRGADATLGSSRETRTISHFVHMAFVVQAHIEDHTLSATTETAKEAFGKAVEWQVVHRLTCVTINDGVRSFTITDFASAMAFLDIANTVGSTSDPRPKVQE